MKLLKKFVLGICQTTCYLIENKGEIILIDAGEYSEKISSYLESKNLKLDKILLTHAHFDHIAGLVHLKEKYPEVKIYSSPEEIKYLADPKLNLASTFNSDYYYDKEVLSTEELSIENLKIRHISGHSLNSTVYIFVDAKTVFSGDTLFKNSIGRSDFLDGNQEKLLSGIKQHLLSLDDDYRVYPGHGFGTTILEEKNNNIFLK